MTARSFKGLFKVVRKIVKGVYPKIKIEGMENLPDEPCIIVANHAQMHGPICCELYPPRKSKTWCASQMLTVREVPQYSYNDFWWVKPKLSKPFYKILSYIIAPISAVIFANANTLPVYRDKRIMSTFKQTVSTLEKGEDIIIFPEKNRIENHILYTFQENFVDVARLYYKRTGKKLKLVPMYIAPRLHKMCLGPAVEYNPQNNAEDERNRVCRYLTDEITKIAEELPRHRIVPYANLPVRLQPFNKEK